MKKKTKNLSKLLNVDLKPLEKDSEGNLVGGFALVDIPEYAITGTNSNCSNDKCSTNDVCNINDKCTTNTRCTKNETCTHNGTCTANTTCDIDVSPEATGTVTTSGFGSMYAF